METNSTEQSCNSIENDPDEDSCGHSDMPSKKRTVSSTNFLSDEESSLPKYRKLTEERVILLERVIADMKEEKTEFNTHASNISSDEFSNLEDNNNGEKKASDGMLNESPEEIKCNCISNGDINMSAEKKFQKDFDTACETSEDSLHISSQKDLPVLERMESIIEEKQKIMRKFAFISSAAKLNNSIIHTPPFSCNDVPSSNKVTISEEHNTEVNTFPNSLKQGISPITTSGCLHDEIQETISNLHEEMPGTSSNIPTDFKAQYVDKKNNMKDLLSNGQFTIIAKTCDKNSSITINQNDSLVVKSEIELQNNVNNISRTLDHNYIQENGVNHKSSHYYSSENVRQSSNIINSIVEEKNISFEKSRENSKLNLAQLVWSLKQDVQVLAKKIDRQEHILDAVANVNEISIAPLFALSFPEKYNLKVPFSTIEEFDKFNEDLAKDSKFCNEFITSLCSYMDNHVTFAKNILCMLKKYMSKDLVTLYTASKSTSNKMVLKETIFCKCMLQATRMTLRNGLLPLEHEKAFMKNLGTVVSAAKGWPTYEEEKK